ncbi:kinectin isoform X2 [Hyposmocoma kahamanoa]|uniref:kinectin isoform X2 n=1 Tax=Hyposmocoma kahamanoa TaxID=1477025 RepID=UPI000E6D65AF|nr:kinectin isoform X2 [Hyposmocoma kahamanoa]
MELQALLVLCGVGVAGVAVVLLMGLFSASGTSYEEAIAQQRRATTELLALAENRNKPKKKEKKANKKLAKKEKREATITTGTGEVESEALAESGVDEDPAPATKPHVEFSPPIVVDVPDTPPNVKIRKRGKDPKVKPILLNKEDPSCVSDPSAVSTPENVISNHFEEMHPKDEFELQHSTLAAEKATEKKEEIIEKKDAKAVKQPKGGKAAAKPAEAAKEEVPRERHNSGEAPKEQRKAKKIEKKPSNEDAVDAPREEIVPPLNAPQPSELTTEKLLKQVASATSANTASPPGGKNKKKKPEPNVLSLMAGEGATGGVNVGELVRLVREAPLSRTEIQILTDALLNRHHDPLPQHSEWTEGPNDPMQKLKKQLADKEKALADEIEASQALHAKLKELRATLNAERGRAAAAARAAEQAAAAARAELHTQQARIQRLLDDNHALAQDKMMLQSKLAAEGEAQSQRVQMEMHIQRLSESEATLVSQLGALQAEIQARVLEAGQARCEASAARDSVILAQQHAAELMQQLQDANHTCNELKNRLHDSSLAEQRMQQELRQAQEQLNGISELQAEVQRLTARAQAAETQVEALKEDIDKQKQEMNKELGRLADEVAIREAELAELKAMKPAQNGLPTNEQHKATEIAKVESVVEALRSELASEARNCIEQRDQLKQLQEQLVLFQKKNDESIAKSQEAHYNEVASVLRNVLPSAAPNSPTGHEWLQTFAENLKRELEKRDMEKKQLETQVQGKTVTKHVEKAEGVLDSRVKELSAQNEHLQGLVDKYKTIIDDTEGVLSRLQHNVTTEEQRWAELLADKQRELDELRLKTLQQMQKKIDALQAELQQAKAANHNHSFADAERLTEERLLMAGLSSKQNTDVCNGPLQVLEEK